MNEWMDERIAAVQVAKMEHWRLVDARIKVRVLGRTQQRPFVAQVPPSHAPLWAAKCEHSTRTFVPINNLDEYQSWTHVARHERTN